MKRLPLVANFVLFIALCMSAVYWALQPFKPQAQPVAPPLAAPAVTCVGDAAGLFGGRRGGEAVGSTYVLLTESGAIKRIGLPESVDTDLKRDNLASTTPSGVPKSGPTMNVGNGQMPGQQPVMRRSSGIGPAAFAALPTPMPSPDHGLVDSSKGPMQNPLIAKSADQPIDGDKRQ